MWGYFNEYDDCSVVTAMYRGIIIGWGLIFYSDERESHEFHVYVSKQYRRCGVGTQIFELASEIFPEGLWVSKWNKTAEGFFNNFDVIEEE